MVFGSVTALHHLNRLCAEVNQRNLPLIQSQLSMVKTVAQKMGLQPNMRAIFINAPIVAIQAINPPVLELESVLEGDFDYIHFFAHHQASFHETFPALKNHLKLAGMLWVSWPKARQEETDLTLTIVIKLGYEYGLVESTCLSINPTWSGLKFTHPKKGKIYNNSYGKLKS
jgi:hypothetical protein